MSITIGSNIASLMAQRHLGKATERVSTAFERLSSGLRINRASDDAAGLAVASSLGAQKRLYTQAVRNISDGLSALAIASGALDSQAQIVTRMQELATQAANGSLSSTQRESLQDEYEKLTFEFARIAATTTFNGVKVLHGANRGGLENLMLQVGIDSQASSRFGVQSGDAGVLSGIFNVRDMFATASDVSGDQQSLEMLYNTFQAGVFVTEDQSKAIVIYGPGANYASPTAITFNRDENGVYVYTLEVALTKNASTGEILSSQTSQLLQDGWDLRALRLSDSNGQYSPNLGTTSNLEFSRVTTQAYARSALTTTTNRLNELNQMRGNIGATESRLRSAMNVSLVQQEQAAAAESQIRDADIAGEAAALAASQILQQVAGEVLRSANIQPQIALLLLKNVRP